MLLRHQIRVLQGIEGKEPWQGRHRFASISVVLGSAWLLGYLLYKNESELNNDVTKAWKLPPF